MVDRRRFQALFSEVRITDVSAPQRLPMDGPNSLGLVDLIVGLGLRIALAGQFFTWARANAEPVQDRFDWRDWLAPSPGLEAAADVWTLGRMDPGLAATVFLVVATIAALSLFLGLFTRITAVIVALGACWHMLAVLPEAWPQTVAYVAIAVALVLRGGGAASIDWILSRLSRFG